MRNEIREGDPVLLYLNRRSKWLIRVKGGQQLHTHVGIVEHSSLLGKEYGSVVKSSLGEELYALAPTIYDFVMKSERKTQIVYPKELGMIAAYTGASPGKLVVEAGTGSGVLTCFLANLVRPDGRIYSYEVREEFLEVARRNLSRMGLEEYVSLEVRDAKEGIPVEGADIAVIDVGDPWSLVAPMKKALKGGGILVGICPTINQVERLVMELERRGFVDINSLELLLRSLEVRPGMSRPSSRMIGHTAYLTFARKALRE